MKKPINALLLSAVVLFICGVAGDYAEPLIAKFAWSLLGAAGIVACWYPIWRDLSDG